MACPRNTECPGSAFLLGEPGPDKWWPRSQSSHTGPGQAHTLASTTFRLAHCLETITAHWGERSSLAYTHIHTHPPKTCHSRIDKIWSSAREGEVPVVPRWQSHGLEGPCWLHCPEPTGQTLSTHPLLTHLLAKGAVRSGKMRTNTLQAKAEEWGGESQTPAVSRPWSAVQLILSDPMKGLLEFQIQRLVTRPLTGGSQAERRTQKK